MRGLHETDAPTYVAAVGSAKKLAFTPVATAAFDVDGFYLGAPQLLHADSDVPELPASYHDAIKWRAMMLLHGADEASESYAFARERYEFYERVLVRLYTNAPEVRGALA